MQKDIWSITMPNMINIQNGIYLMNDKSIMNIFYLLLYPQKGIRIFFAVTQYFNTPS
jgi:hypothetical protein